MIINEKAWHYIAVKELSALTRRITSKNNGEEQGGVFLSELS